MNELSLFTGIGGMHLALWLAGRICGFEVNPVAMVEREYFSVCELVKAFQKGWIPETAIWSDVETFPAHRYREKVDIVTASPPCQPYSTAGKREGNSDRRSWGGGNGPVPHTVRIIAESDPGLVFFENVGQWVSGGHFKPVKAELQRLGFIVAPPLFLSARDLGATHKRERVWILAYKPGIRYEATGGTRSGRSGTESEDGHQTLADTISEGSEGRQGGKENHDEEFPTTKRGCRDDVADSTGERGELKASREHSRFCNAFAGCDEVFPPGPGHFGEWERILEYDSNLAPALPKSEIRGMVDGSSRWVDEIRSLGNALVPVVGAYAFITLAECAGLIEFERGDF